MGRFGLDPARLDVAVAVADGCDADREPRDARKVTAKAFRRMALRHAVPSYMYGALIIATTINLIAGLGK